MTNTKQNLHFFLLSAIFAALVVLAFREIPAPQVRIQAPELSGVVNALDTSSSNISHATTTINTTSTQVWASITKMGEIINDTTGKLTCSMDATNTTAASSSVVAGRGIIIVPAASSTSNLPNVVRFGECSGTGNVPCYPHKGAVNCLSNVQATTTTWSK